MNHLLIVLPFHTGDAPLALKLLQWHLRLKQPVKHSILLAADSKTPVEICKEIGAAARAGFKHVIPISLRVEGSGVKAANAMFYNCSQWVKQHSRMDFLWLEPDCVPVRADWIDALCKEYDQAPTGFMGTIVNSEMPHLPPLHLPGCSVYPREAFDLLAPFCNATAATAWDMGMADMLVKGQHITATKLIQSLYGQQDKPPTFVAKKEQGVTYEDNVFSPDLLKIPDTVLFHRCKDGSLFEALSAPKAK